VQLWQKHLDNKTSIEAIACYIALRVGAQLTRSAIKTRDLAASPDVVIYVSLTLRPCNIYIFAAETCGNKHAVPGLRLVQRVSVKGEVRAKRRLAKRRFTLADEASAVQCSRPNGLSAGTYNKLGPQSPMQHIPSCQALSVTADWRTPAAR
jgi:hypothetical protein